MEYNKKIVKDVKNTLVTAASSYRKDLVNAYSRAIQNEQNPKSAWVMQMLVENSRKAESNRSPLCDDTGIPHLFLELGRGSALTPVIMQSINKGVCEGLKALPGRPMAVIGNDIERLEQKHGLFLEPDALIPAPMQIRLTDDNGMRLSILMQGGGPEIRAKTFRVFHKHSIDVIVNEIVEWAIEGASKLGCTPCTPAIGIGRSHVEASSLMLEAMVKGRFDKQSDLENEITAKINKSNVGALGLSGSITALASFVKIGPQRASGVRIVSLRLCCCVEPRVASCLI